MRRIKVDQPMGLFEPQDNLNQNMYVDGRLKAIFFSSNDSFYKVLLIEITDTNLNWPESEIVVTGNFGDVVEENSYHFTGKVIDHPRYGKQFQAANYTSLIATTKEGVIKYLSGDRFPGIGKQTAQRVVKVLGDDAIQRINADGRVLDQVPITQKQRDAILDNLSVDDGLEKVIVGLNSYGFSSKIASDIYEKYHGDALKIISENPYQLVEDIRGISFKRADAIALKLGLTAASTERIRAGLLYAIQELCFENGDTYTTTSALLNMAGDLLDNNAEHQVSGQQLGESLIELAKEHKVVGEGDRIYLSYVYNAEVQIAEHLNRIIKNKDDGEDHFSDDAIKSQIRMVESKFDINYDDSQSQAIMEAVKSPAFILTGGPGTGKTTIINGIVNTYARLHEYSLDINEYKDKPFPIVLAAPTGRAAKHMSDSTGLPASTIHRLLGLNGQESADYTSPKDIEGSLLIIDEMSMVDTFLFRLLMRAVPNHMQIIFVGDQDQLPSVGPGQVFHDLLTSKQLPAMHLDNIYRQEKGSSIVQLAHDIHAGKLSENFDQNQSDRSFIACNETQLPSVIEQVARRAKDKDFGLMDVQVLAPMYRGTAGIDHLNNILQNVWQVNPTGKSVTIRDHTYRIGDKVLQLVNNPEQNVFNGDLGIIVGMEAPKNQAIPTKIIIDFDETEVTYEKNEWIQFTLAYCTSIHKAQGSEFPMVILPIVRQYSRMLQRNLLYTAVTRASDFLIMLGEKQAFEQCVRSISVNRKTSLVQRLVEAISEEPYQAVKNPSTDNLNDSVSIKNNHDEQQEAVASSEPRHLPDHLTGEMINDEQVDPMIGMDGITPYQFDKSNMS
ncbi:ATP-dependent RecD-like DNA helicase [Lentilactobacillus hilgardii]|nr:ATP-dependent RecD-like DNA helicase [Lentilactobacillus hilgardii]